MKKIKMKSLILIAIGLIGCNSKPMQSSGNEKITNELFLLNSSSWEDLHQKWYIPFNDFSKGDTVLVESNFNMNLFGKDSTHTKALTIWKNSKSVYAYSFRKSLVFDVYDSLRKFVDRGAINGNALLRILNSDIDFRKAEFYNKLMEEREKNYEAVAKKYAISRYELDGLVQDELDKKQKDN